MDRFSALYDYFQHSDRRYFESTGTIPAFDTQKGIYAPCHLPHVKLALEAFMTRRRISQGGLLDAGSGDGRVVFLAAMLGYDAVGVEFEGGLVNAARMHMSELIDKGILKESELVRFVQGDFTDPETYHSKEARLEGIERVRVFYNYISAEQELASVIGQISPLGTSLLVYGPEEDVFRDLAPLSQVEEMYVRDNLRPRMGFDVMQHQVVMVPPPNDECVGLYRKVA